MTHSTMTSPIADAIEGDALQRSESGETDVLGTPAVANVDGTASWVDMLDPEGRLPTFPVPWRHPIRAIVWIVRTLFGLASLLLLLGVIAAIPLVNVIALGYLLEVEGRIGRSGRLRDAFPLLNVAPRIGAIVFGVWIWMLPLRFLGGAAADANIIDADGSASATLNVLVGLGWLLTTVHVCGALARGGSLSCFFRPIKNVRWLWARLNEGDYLETASAHIRAFVKRLRLKEHFWLGLRGIVVAFAWLIVPTALFAVVASNPDGTMGPQLAVTIVGGILLGLTLAWMPFLQARFATENRLRSGFALFEVRRLFAHAPLAWLTAIAVTYVLALPLYLFKAFVLPQDALWAITLVFVASIYPARVVTGWAYHRATKRRDDGLLSRWYVRWLARLGMLPLLAAFVFILYFTQFIGAHGTAGLFEHHAFLLPWPGDPTP